MMTVVKEGFLAVPGGQVYYREVGDGATPLLCLHGGPGMGHDYIEALEDLADERRVVFYDQLGCGRSERPDDPSLWTVARSVDELMHVRVALKLTSCHLFGSSWGGMLALAYVLDHSPSLVSLTLASSPGSVPKLVEECTVLRSELPAGTQRTLDYHEQTGFLECPEYIGAAAEFYRRHLCRMSPWPEGLERTFAGMGLQVYNTMFGPTEFTATGNLKDWDVMDRLSAITIPTLVTAGRYDEVQPQHAEAIAQRIGGAELVIFEESAHLAFEEERAAYMAMMRSFLRRTEERAASTIS